MMIKMLHFMVVSTVDPKINLKQKMFFFISLHHLFNRSTKYFLKILIYVTMESFQKVGKIFFCGKLTFSIVYKLKYLINYNNLWWQVFRICGYNLEPIWWKLFNFLQANVLASPCCFSSGTSILIFDINVDDVTDWYNIFKPVFIPMHSFLKKLITRK